MTGCCANATPLAAVAEGCVVIVTWVAGPTEATVMVIVLDVAPVSADVLKFNVRSPAVPLTDRSKKAAAPLALVIGVSVVPSVPPPVAIVTVTAVPTWLTGLAAAARN